MGVPFLDLKAQYSTIKDEIDTAVAQVLASCAFAGGPFVEKFENEWATYCGVKHAVGVGSGTEALWLALLSLGIGPGDEVITVPNTFIATAEAISLTRATPVFVDVDEKHYTMDPKLLKSAITVRTKAVIPVHIFGQMADMDPIMEIAREYGLFVIEDACQAHGAAYRGQKAGSIGDAAAFSFYPGKNLGAYGEAGAVTTNNDEIDAKIRIFRDHGQTKKYHHDIVGWNARMDGIHGAVLSVKLKYLDTWNDKRRTLAAYYRRLLDELESVVLPEERKGSRHVYHLYAVRVNRRDAIVEFLKAGGIGTGIHYPVPIHNSKAYAEQPKGKPLHAAVEIADQIVSLPMYAELADNPRCASEVCEQIAAFFDGKASIASTD